MTPYGLLYICMPPHGYLLLHMASYFSLCLLGLPTAPSYSIWLLITSFGFLCFHMAPYGFLWLPLSPQCSLFFLVRYVCYAAATTAAAALILQDFCVLLAVEKIKHQMTLGGIFEKSK